MKRIITFDQLGKYHVNIARLCIHIEIKEWNGKFYTFINSSNLRMVNVASIFGRIYISAIGGHYVYYGLTRITFDPTICEITVEGYTDLTHMTVFKTNLYNLMVDANPILPKGEWKLSCTKIV